MTRERTLSLTATDSTCILVDLRGELAELSKPVDERTLFNKELERGVVLVVVWDKSLVAVLWVCGSWTNELVVVVSAEDSNSEL